MTIFLIFILFAVILWRRTSSWDSISKNCLSTYLILWLISLIIASLGVYDLPIPCFDTYMYQLLHIFSFAFGYSLVKIRKDKQMNLLKLSNLLNKICDSKWTLFVALVYLLYMLVLLQQYFIQVQISQSFAELRTSYYEGGLYGPLYDLLRGPVLEPLCSIFTFLFAYSIINHRSFLTWILLANLGIYLSLSGGRFGYVLLCLAVFFVYMTFNQVLVNKQKSLMTMTVLGCLLLFLLVYITGGRTGEVDSSLSDNLSESIESTKEQLTSYTSAPNVAFEYALEHDYVSKIGGYQYGTLTLGAIENIAYTICTKLGCSYRRPLKSFVTLIQDRYIYLGSVHWNALYTSSLIYYCDLGIFGLFLFPFIFGILFRVCIKSLYIYKSITSFILVGCVFLKVVFAICMFDVTDMFYVIFLLLLFYFRKSYGYAIS